MNKTARPSKRKSTAQAMVEFALALPILLMVMYGLIESARLIFMYASVVSAARQAVTVRSTSLKRASMSSVSLYLSTFKPMESSGHHPDRQEYWATLPYMAFIHSSVLLREVLEGEGLVRDERDARGVSQPVTHILACEDPDNAHARLLDPDLRDPSLVCEFGRERS